MVRRRVARLLSLLVGSLALAAGVVVTLLWQPDGTRTVGGTGFTVNQALTGTSYEGLYTPLPSGESGPARAQVLDGPVDTSLRWEAFPGWLAVLLAGVFVLLAALGTGRRVPLAALAAASAAAALAAEPALGMPLGSALMRLVVVLAPALAALVVLHLVLGRRADGVPPGPPAGPQPTP